MLFLNYFVFLLVKCFVLCERFVHWTVLCNLEKETIENPTVVANNLGCM